MSRSAFQRSILGLFCGLGALLILSPIGAQCDPGNGVGGLGPDVAVGELYTPTSYGSAGGYHAFSVGTVSCNIGTADINWFELTDQHPVITQNLYRLRDGRFEQIGLSWLKHGFAAVVGDICGCSCTPSGTSQMLGVGCSDPYSAGLNGNQSNLGPRSDLFDAVNGTFLFPPTLDPPNTDLTWRRLRVKSEDLDPAQNIGAVYLAEAHYLTPDDAIAGNGANNASHRRVAFATNPQRTMSFIGDTERQLPAIRAWQIEDPSVTLIDIPDGDGGLLILGVKTTDLGGGLYSYEYALHNIDSTRAVRSFSIPLDLGVDATEIGFHDVEYHSGDIIDGTDWTPSTGGALSWATQTYAENPNANALRYSSLYNFRFVANAAPTTVDLSLGLFTPGVGDTLSISVPGPGIAIPLVISLPSGPAERVVPDGIDVLSVEISAISGAGIEPGSELLWIDTGSGFTSIGLVPRGAGLYDVTFPPILCGQSFEYYLSAVALTGEQVSLPTLGSLPPFPGESAYGVVETFDALEDPGLWLVGPPNTATDGTWAHGDPIGTGAQPEDDHSTGVGTNCWFTGQGSAGGADTEADVDGGLTTLYSPFLDLSASFDPVISYWRWYSNDVLPTIPDDVFVVEVSANGLDWEEVEVVGPSGPETSGGWFEHSFRVLDHIPLSASTQVRFIAGDPAPGAIVEAAIDDFRIRDLDCTAPDCNSNGVPDPVEIANGTAEDCNGNEILDVCDIAAGTSSDSDSDGVPDECQFPEFIRGDTDSNGGTDIADAINMLATIFQGQPTICEVALDANADAQINIADPISLLGYLFSGAPALPPPFFACGLETVPSGLGCDSFPGCP